MQVRGRESERERVEQLLADPDAWPAVLALEGVPGIGKSTLWREGVGLARERGLRVIATAPSEPDQGLAFAALGDLFSGLPADTAGALPAPQQRALSAALFEAESEPEIDSEALPRAVLGVIRGLATRAPLLIAIDDEQWLDRPSARVLAFSLSRLRAEPVGVLIARRRDANSMLWPELVKRTGETSTVALQPLDQAVLDQLVVARVRRPIARPQLRRIREVSGGNPLYALAIADELASADNGDIGGPDLPLPSSVTEAMAARLDQLEARAADPLLVAAAVSRPSLALIQSLLPDFVLGDLDSAAGAGVIELAGDRIRFTHPLLAATHYSSSEPARRRELHRLLADVLKDEVERAYHLARGAEAPDREIAVRIELAAEDAARRGAPDTGAQLLEHASRLTPLDAEEVRRSRIISAAELHFAGGDAPRARELLEAVLPELPHGPVRARALLQLADVGTDDLAASQTLLEEALRDAGDHHRLVAEIELVLESVLDLRAEFNDGLVHARAALAAAARTNDDRFLAVMTAYFNTGPLFMSGGAVDLDAVRGGIEFEDSVRLPTGSRPSSDLAHLLFMSDDYAQARPAIDEAIRFGEQRGAVYDVGWFVFHHALIEWYDGDPVAAERHRVESAELLRAQGLDAWDMLHMYLDALFAAGRGELEAAQALALPALELGERTNNPNYTVLPLTLLAGLDLWAGQPAAAHDRLRPFRRSFLDNGFGFIGAVSLGLWSIDIEALVALDRLDQAQPVIDDLRHRAQHVENPNAIAIAERCQGLLLGARGEVGLAITALESALAEHERRPLNREIARTLLELGTLQRRAKRKTAAKQTLEQALAMFEAMDAQMWIARTRDELGRIGLRRAVVSEGLTPAQERVAELVASGMSNREVASTLYMSLRSVESHLTKIYRELGVKSRSQLVATLAAKSDAAAHGDGARVSDHA